MVNMDGVRHQEVGWVRPPSPVWEFFPHNPVFFLTTTLIRPSYHKLMIGPIPKLNYFKLDPSSDKKPSSGQSIFVFQSKLPFQSCVALLCCLIFLIQNMLSLNIILCMIHSESENTACSPMLTTVSSFLFSQHQKGWSKILCQQQLIIRAS